MQDSLQNKNSQTTTSLAKDLSSRRLEARKALEGEERRAEREKDEAILFAKKTDEARLRIIEEKEKEKNKEAEEVKEKSRQSGLEKQRHTRLQIIKDRAFEKKRAEDIRIARQEAFFKKIKPTQKKPNSSTVYDIKPRSEATVNENTPKVTRIKTYKNDITKTIKKQNSSIVQIANKEKVKIETRNLKLNPSTKAKTSEKNWAGIIILILIIGISGILAIYKFDSTSLFTFFKKPSVTTPINEQNLIPALISSNTEKNILIQDGTNNILDLIVKEIQSNTSSSDTIKNIYLTKTKEIKIDTQKEIINEVTGVQELLSLWVNFMPERLSRSLNYEFMLGTYTPEKTLDSVEVDLNSAFLILTTDTQSQAFAGMLEWEKSIHGDIYELFGLDASINNNSNAFYDGIVNGADVRILNDIDGEIAIIYSFLNENMIVITTKIETLAQVSQRL